MEATDVKLLKKKLGTRYSTAILKASKYRVTRTQIVNFFNLRPVEETAKEIIVKSAVAYIKKAEQKAKRLKRLAQTA